MVAPPTVNPAILRQSLIKKMPPQTCLQADLKEAIPHLRFLFPDDSSLCQLDRSPRAQFAVVV